MPAALALHLLGVLGWLKKLAVALVDLARRYPWQALALVLLCACAWQTRQAHEWRDTSHRWQAAAKAMQDASEANAAAALAQHKAWEAKSAQIAKDSENDHAKALADARGAADRYIATHRVRTVQGGICAAPAAGQGEGAGLPEKPAAEADMVAMSAGDITTCATDYTYAQSAYEWAKGLLDQGLGE